MTEQENSKMAQIKAITKRLPTYLNLLLEEDSNVRFVYKEIKKTSNDHSRINCSTDNTLQLLEDVSQIDLTGTPLETDLGADDSVFVEAICEQPTSWTAEEAKHYPLSLEEARKFINNESKSKKSIETILCICDGKDDSQTVTLGTTITPSQLVRTLAYILPCCDENDKVTTVSFMKEEHLKILQGDSKLSVASKKIYNLFGYNLKNCQALDRAKFNGNIAIEITQDSRVSQLHLEHKLFLQVVVGHNQSPLFDFWKNLCLIQSFIQLNESPAQLSKFAEIGLDSAIDCVQITDLISDVITSVTTINPMEAKLKNLNLDSLRPLSILDQLWDILKRCATVYDLRKSFHFCFEELAEKTQSIYGLSDSTAVGEIVIGILDGKMAVPTLTISQCLQLLIELGLEKLKNDYIAIISRFCDKVQSTVLQQWNELSSANVEMSSKSSQRRSRASINPNAVMADLSGCKLKLNYLDMLHTISEFILLYKNHLPEAGNSLHTFYDAVSTHFITQFRKKTTTFSKQERLCQFSHDLLASDGEEAVRNLFPVAFSTRLSSRMDYAEVRTVFYFSKYPIFPPSLFENYGEDSNDLYVTKLVQYIQHI